MSLPERDRNERDVAALGALLRVSSEAGEAARRTSMPARRRDLASRQKLVEAMRVPPPRRRAWIAGFAFAAVVACAAFLFLRVGKLSYTIDGGDEGGYVRAEAHTTMVRFAEGSTFAFGGGSSGRVNAVTADGASIVLEDGSLEASVVHRDGAKWSTLAGPWEVRVTGTRFDLAWDPRLRLLRVDLLDGKVVVHGPGAEEGISLHAGQTLRAREGEGIHVSSLVRTASMAPSVESTTASSASAPGSAEVAEGTATAPSAERGPAGLARLGTGNSAAPAAAGAPDAPVTGEPPRVSWTELVAKGKHDQVLAEARGRGVDAVVASGSVADLLALADASRYSGDGSLASRSLRALRDRFAGTKAATDAAFFLGRMTDDGGSPAGAIRYYDAHIAEGGAFAAEALGRKMIAVRRSSGDAAARTVALQYVDRFPRGAHVTVARALIEGDVGFAKDTSPH